MIWLILSIATSSLLYVIFKGFAVYNVNRLHAIIVNYLVACVTGFFMFSKPVKLNIITGAAWLPFAMVLGLLFLSIFNVMAITSQRNGLSVAAVASKMSLAIPVIAGIWLYDESMGWLKMSGILIALLSVYLAAARGDKTIKLNRKLLIYPLLLFIGSGLIDTILKYAEQSYVSDGMEPLFSAVCFGCAFIVGVLILIYHAFKGRFLTMRSLLAGIILGVPNYFSIFFIIKALKQGMDSSVVYPINHVGTVIITSLFGLLVFKELITRRNYIGIVLAVVAIILIAL